MREIHGFYADLFTADIPGETTDRCKKELLSCLPNGISDEVNEMLVRPTSEEDTKSAVFQMGGLEL